MQTRLQAKRHSILVIDDDRSISRLIKHNLADASTEVIEANTGLDGIIHLRQDKTDLILLDIRLPDFSGWGILSLLRLTEPLSRIPVLIVSVEPPDASLIKQLKPDDYVRKPFDMSDLIRRVRKLLPLTTSLSRGEGGVM